MKNRNLIQTVMVILMIVLFSSGLMADVYMKQKSTTSGFQMMGQSQPGEEKIIEMWMTKDKIASISPTETSIMYAKDNKIVFINHTDKTWMEMVLSSDAMEGQMGGKDMDKEDKEAFNKMMQGMSDIKITITPTSETKKIGKWMCKKYIQTVEMFTGPMKSEIWTTESLKMDQELYTRFMSSMFAKMPGMDKSMGKYVKEMKKLKGVAVLTTMTHTIMGNDMTSTTELLDYKTGTAPAKIFKYPPPGYKKMNGFK